MPALDPRDRLQRFVLRARRVLAHSLVRDDLDLLNEVARGTFKIAVETNRETGESTHRLKIQLPPEEAFESLAARLRPFTIGKESVYWSSVLDALEKLLSKETLASTVDIQSLRDYWSEVVEGSKVAQIYYFMTDNGTLTDVELADRWLNSDSLHTEPIKSAIGQDTTLNERYRAAAGVWSRIGACMENTYCLIVYLVNEGLLHLDASVFTEPVVADSEIDQPTKVYCTPVGAAPMPTSMDELDFSQWRQVHEDPEVLARVGPYATAVRGTDAVQAQPLE
ncbi:hypothetical protein [Mycolicibacterium litorale]|uniref:Uncharacterized protein n=1 Tax=Mycolicibacterium litorale TaxID=758802 RepID=A0AAD1IG74_9MYCO|nr:hypothetical protein [Mycolicibacterium litorale]TDY03304.1 hypothetical protein BCL50_4373 [Mycolicibacterium litorale]BBY15100.1 hypothetical protein MLIT_06920 [Mycolicibacterium litorale]